jgi:hypothetical protein
MRRVPYETTRSRGARRPESCLNACRLTFGLGRRRNWGTDCREDEEPVTRFGGHATRHGPALLVRSRTRIGRIAEGRFDDRTAAAHRCRVTRSFYPGRPSVVRFESFVSNDPVRLRSGSFAREQLAPRATAAALRTLVGIEHEGPCVLGRARSGRVSSGVRRGVPDFDGSGDERPEGATPRRRRKHGRAGRARLPRWVAAWRARTRASAPSPTLAEGRPRSGRATTPHARGAHRGRARLVGPSRAQSKSRRPLTAGFRFESRARDNP